MLEEHKTEEIGFNKTFQQKLISSSLLYVLEKNSQPQITERVSSLCLLGKMFKE